MSAILRFRNILKGLSRWLYRGFILDHTKSTFYINETSIPFIMRFFPFGNGRHNPRGVLAVNASHWTMSYILIATFLFFMNAERHNHCDPKENIEAWIRNQQDHVLTESHWSASYIGLNSFTPWTLDWSVAKYWVPCTWQNKNHHVYAKSNICNEYISLEMF